QDSNRKESRENRQRPMFSKTYTSTRGVLSPSMALRLFNLYIENTRRIDNDNNILMELCLDASFALSRIHQSDIKNLASPASNEDRILCQGIASAYNEVARLFEHLGRSSDAEKNDRKARKWGYVQDSNITYHEPSQITKSININNNNSQNNSSTSVSRLKEAIKIVGTATTNSIAIIPSDIFDHNVPQVVFKYNLPQPDVHLNDIHQLAYCLNLLPTAPHPLSNLTIQEQEWALATSNDRDEQERLFNLASDVITMFIHDDIKAEATVAEVVVLAPVLDYDQYRTLLLALINGISQNIMLETHLLEGLAQLMQHAPLGYLDSDDLVHILNTLSSRLQGTHEQSSSHIHQICVTVSHVLDAMVNNQIKGLKREQLHEPLAAYLNGLKGSSDPHLAYHAAYASQALLYIPNDETTIQTMLRRTSAVARGVFGVVSAVKGLDFNAFIYELTNIQKGLPLMTDAVNKSLRMYSNATSFYASGEAFKQSMEEGLAFSHKSAWYPALRGADTYLQSGDLIKFKTLVCEAPCRRDIAFQWGICQRLGQIAASTKWTIGIRQDAVSSLGEIYKNDRDWDDHVEIKQWIITILKRLPPLSKEGPQAAEQLLSDLAMDGDTNKQQLYRNCFNEPVAKYPFITILPPSASSSLLDHVQNRPDVEKNLRLLKRQRMETRDDQSFYIQQYAKAGPQASDGDLFLLMDKVKEFLDSDRKVMLVQGDSGAGKSTFNRSLESALWEVYQKRRGRIPLFINLPSIDYPAKDMVAKQLRIYNFSYEQIKEMKKTRSFILICDGYDETMQTSNLYVTNHLNQPGEWMCQMVISCRSEYLGIDYRDRFQPMGRNHQADAGLFQEAVIVPFSEAQIDEYIKQYVAAMDLMWGVDDYQQALKMIPSLRELVKNPFILSLSLEVLPRMVDPHQDVSKTQIKRVTLYDKFVELWLERGKKRLSEIIVSEDKSIFRILCDEGFAQNGIMYLTDLAVAIYKHQDGNPMVDYSPSRDKGTWKEEYFSRESKKNLLREASPLSRTGTQYRFVHRSILEYCMVRAMFEPQKEVNATASDREALATPTYRRGSTSSLYSFEMEENNVIEQGVSLVMPDETSPLVWRSFVNDPSILQFLEDRVQLEAKFKQQLYEYVELSKSDSKWRIAAANALTILIRAGESFIEADLRGIQVPGADLSHGIFDGTQLQGADLRKANLHGCWLQKADLNGAKMSGVQFGEWPLLREEGLALKGSYSPSSKTLAAVLYNQQSKEAWVSIYDTLTWKKCLALKLGNDFSYSPDSQHVAIARGNTVDILDVASGALIHRLEGYTGIVNAIMYSPSGDHLISISIDGSAHVWDTTSGILHYTLKGHTGKATSVVYSPDGKQIASGGEGNVVQLWDAASGELIRKLQVWWPRIEQIVYSPDSQEIITRGYDAHLLDVWDARSGQKKWVMEHKRHVGGVQYSPCGKFATSFTDFGTYQWSMQTRKVIHAIVSFTKDLRYSPNGEQIAICCFDHTVQLWDAQTGQLINTLYGHTNIIRCVAFSSNGHQIASFSEDGTIRLWGTQSQQSNHGHTKAVFQVKFSPSGQHVASCSYDSTIRIWDSRTGRCIHVLQRPVKDIRYSPDGQLAYFGIYNDPCAYLWDTQSGQVVHTLKPPNWDDSICDLDFSPIDYQIACGHLSGDVSVWNTQTGQLIYTLQGNGNLANYVLFSPNGHQIALYDEGKRIKVWTTHSGDLLYELEGLDLTGLFGRNFVYSPDSQRIAFIQDKTKLQLRSAETGELCFGISFNMLQTGIAFSPSSQQMVVGSKGGPINVVDTESETMVYRLEGHTNEIITLSYSCDGQYIVSTSFDMTVRLWDAESAKCLAVIPFIGGVVFALSWNITEEGCFLVTGCGAGSVRMWQITKEEDGQCNVRLKWNTKQTGLYAGNTRIQGVSGLSEMNRRLLEQYGAVDDTTQCSVSQEASHEKTARSVATEFKIPESKTLDTNLRNNDSKAVQLIAKSEATKGHQFICSKCSECNECEVAHFILSGSYDSTGQHCKENIHPDLVEEQDE
ncbi:hypothetical protein BX616_011186, partial [Lobosporangium transversale]